MNDWSETRAAFSDLKTSWRDLMKARREARAVKHFIKALDADPAKTFSLCLDLQEALTSNETFQRRMKEELEKFRMPRAARGGQ